MDAAKFESTSIAILRTATGWQSAIARRLDIQPRQVRRWLQQGFTPDWVDEKLAEMIGATDISPWPRDEWLIGDGITPGWKGRHEYVMHMQVPRFIARIVNLDDAGRPDRSEHPVDIYAGTVYQINDNTLLCEIAWVDAVAPGEHVLWLEAAANALDDEQLYPA